MNTKLTLSVNQSVVEEAKKYAKASGKSLSNIVEEYLKSLSNFEQPDKKKATLKIIKELKGSVKLPEDDKSYKELLEDALLAKYLNR